MDQKLLESHVSGWPGVTRDIKWHDDLVFSVGGKMFAVYCLRGSNAGQVSFKVGEERFLEMTDRHGVIPAPYMARAHWVSVLPSSGIANDEILALVRGSYEMIRARLTKRLQRELAD